MSAFTRKKSWSAGGNTARGAAFRDSRRAFVRVDFDKGAKIGVAFGDGERAYDALDLTVYGVSFLAPADDIDRFVEGQELPALAFVIDGEQITARGKVVYIRKGLASGLAKVAVELTSVEADGVWRLSRHVAERAGLGRTTQLGKKAVRLAKGEKSKAKPKAKKPKAKKPTAKKKLKAKRKSR
jgi:hypothetical protein